MDVDGISGYLVRGGGVIDKVKLDTTFSKSFVLDQEEFICVSIEGGSHGEGIKWMRFPFKERITDRGSMSPNYWDCACFSPNRDIKFLGFGIFGQFDGKDITFEVKWRIDGEDSEVYDFDTSQFEKNED